jgi:hypothetical protein
LSRRAQKSELGFGFFNSVITRFMRVIQQPRVCVAEESLGAMDIAPLDCPDKPGNDDGGGMVSCTPDVVF